MVINQGSSDVAEQSKAIITAAIVGLVIIYGGWAAVDLFMQRMNYNAANPGVKWYNVPCSMIHLERPMALAGGIKSFSHPRITQLA